jgi:hypothetical protein
MKYVDIKTSIIEYTPERMFAYKFTLNPEDKENKREFGAWVKESSGEMVEDFISQLEDCASKLRADYRGFCAMRPTVEDANP